MYACTVAGLPDGCACSGVAGGAFGEVVGDAPDGGAVPGSAGGWFVAMPYPVQPLITTISPKRMPDMLGRSADRESDWEIVDRKIALIVQARWDSEL